MGNSKISPIEIQKHLGGVDYPASKQELVDHVSKNGEKKKEVIEIMKKIPDKKYNSPVDVSKAVSDQQ